MLPTTLTPAVYQPRPVDQAPFQAPFFDQLPVSEPGRRAVHGQQLAASGQPLLWALSAILLAACGVSTSKPQGPHPVPQSLRPAGEGTDFLYTGPVDPLRQGKTDGRGGDDHLVFVAHDSIVAGGSGDDLLILRGAENRVWGDAGDDLLIALSGRHHLQGGAGDDALHGGRDSDQMTGGAGRDILTGGLGGDVFVLTEAASTMLTADVITDFGFSAQDRPPMPDALEFADNTTTIWVRGNIHAATGRLHGDGNDPSHAAGTDTVLYADAAASRILAVLEDWDLGATVLANHLMDSSITLIEVA